MAQYIIAGPCSMESMEQMDQIAQALIDLKINVHLFLSLAQALILFRA